MWIASWRLGWVQQKRSVAETGVEGRAGGLLEVWVAHAVNADGSTWAQLRLCKTGWVGKADDLPGVAAIEGGEAVKAAPQALEQTIQETGYGNTHRRRLGSPSPRPDGD